MTSEQDLRLLPVAALVFQNGSVAYWNEEFRSLLRVDGDEKPGESSSLVLDIVAHYMGTVAAGHGTEDPAGTPAGVAKCVQMPVTRADGSSFGAEVTGVSILWNGQPALQLCLRDASQVQQVSAKLASLAGGSIAGILVHRDMRPLFVNDAYAKMYGYRSRHEILRMQSILQLTDPDDRDKVWGYYVRRMRGEQVPSRYIHRSRTRDGRQILVDNLVTVVNWDGQPAVQVTNLDVTQYVTSPSVDQYDRQAIFSEVAAGMAKRFVRHSGDLTRELEMAFSSAYLEGHGKVLEPLQRMQASLRSMQGDLEALLVGARGGAEVTHPLDLAGVVAEVIQDRVRSEETPAIRAVKILLSMEAGQRVPPVVGDVLHVRRMINSLLDNAVEAMPQGGEVTVSVRTVKLTRSNKGVKQGRYAVIEVADSGPGIDAAVMERLGEPFVTTKEGHAGIGLSGAISVMQRHHGYATFQPNKPRGTLISLYFPLVREVE